MTTKRLAVLLGILAAGMGVVFFIPQEIASQPTGIELQLPAAVGEWWGRDLEISEKEIQVLGEGTEFSRKSYSNGRGDELQVSIVLSGQDMSTSIHRPERCLPAQGWTVTNNGGRTVRIPDYGSTPVTRLYNVRSVSGPDGKAMQLYNINYYWFVGHTDVTRSHIERTFIDLQDRIFKGFNQRWAYITVSANVTANRSKFGRDERQTDELIEDLIRLLVPKIQKDSVRR